MTENPRLVLTKRFTEAVEYARQLHTEYRKGTDIPYMAHLIGVAALVMGEAGGRVPVTEDMVIAALLHDAVEDHGGTPRLREIEQPLRCSTSPAWSQPFPTLSRRTTTKKNLMGERKNQLHLAGCATSPTTCCSSPPPTSSTTQKQFWMISTKSARQSLLASSVGETTALVFRRTPESFSRPSAKSDRERSGPRRP